MLKDSIMLPGIKKNYFIILDDLVYRYTISVISLLLSYKIKGFYECTVNIINTMNYRMFNTNSFMYKNLAI